MTILRCSVSESGANVRDVEGQDDDCLSIGGVARMLGLSRRAIHALAARGDLVVEGWPIRVRRAEVDDFIRRSRLKPGELGRSLNMYRRC
jgi:hypothetical protein